MKSSVRFRHALTAVTLSCFGLSFSLTSPGVFALDFSQSYTAYKQAVAEKNNELALKYAQQAYELGSVEFGPQSLDTATLALN